MMVAVSGIIKEGYRPLALLSDDLRQEVLRDKKAEKIIADIKAAGATTIDQIKNMTNAVNDSVKHVTFSAPAYITALRSTEPVVSAFAAASQQGQVSAPLKGQSGIIVLQPYASNKINDTFDAATEESRTVNTNVNVVGSQFTTDLYMKAKVTDNRYLYF
jgi:peptidyl-prolyl cis-trans isomerase D